MGKKAKNKKKVKKIKKNMGPDVMGKKGKK